jgi:hypothetical protein
LLPVASLTTGVGQPANHAIRPNSALIGTLSHREPSFQSLVVGVGHPVQPLSDVRSADARSAQIGCCRGVTRSFQVSLYKVEPLQAVFTCNLLAKDDWRSALADEPVERRPKVPLISKPCAFACRAERLAWAGTRPDRAVVGPSGST